MCGQRGHFHAVVVTLFLPVSPGGSSLAGRSTEGFSAATGLPWVGAPVWGTTHIYKQDPSSMSLNFLDVLREDRDI